MRIVEFKDVKVIRSPYFKNKEICEKDLIDWAGAEIDIAIKGQISPSLKDYHLNEIVNLAKNSGGEYTVNGKFFEFGSNPNGCLECNLIIPKIN